MIHFLLNGKQIILASASPRRKQIFDLVGIKALQVPPKLDETNTLKNPIKLVKLHAANKAAQVASQFSSDCIIVAADTIVYHQREILGKPQDKFQAIEYLRRLSGCCHYVYTGIAISYKHHLTSNYTRSQVLFNNLSSNEIKCYIDTGEPFDKAGAYGIQGYGSQFISKI
ncbi:MAG: septum formation protein Maf, partial [Candidatus Cloacimonetes bacterium]|nr:septum formation protein Maf [Candidatus Cloacimonadota bacterium]